MRGTTRAALFIAATSLTMMTSLLRGVGWAAPLVVTDLEHGVSPSDLATTLAGAGVTVSNVQFAGSNVAAGTFSGGSDMVGFGSGIILGSGRVQTIAGLPACSKGVEGPNTCDANTTSNGTPGDPQLDALSSEITLDAAVLEFDFIPQFGTVRFDYVFSSDEYNEFVNSSFNDVFGFFVNGTNCALTPTGQPVTINNINGGNPFGTGATNPALYRNNDPDDPGPPTIDTEMDGLTVVLTCEAVVNANQTNHMKLAIADASDSSLDSNVFLGAQTLVSGQSLTVTKAGTGTGTVTSSPAGIDCGSDCTESYATGTSVTLTATPSAGSVFAGWSGACTGTGTCTVAMTEARSVTATFDLSADPPTLIRVDKSAFPSSRPQPGGTFTFILDVLNAGSAPVVLTSLVDDLHGDLSGRGSCQRGVTLQPGEIYSCAFAVRFTGNAGSTETDRVTATATDASGQIATATSNQATISITASETATGTATRRSTNIEIEIDNSASCKSSASASRSLYMLAQAAIDNDANAECTSVATSTRDAPRPAPSPLQPTLPTPLSTSTETGSGTGRVIARTGTDVLGRAALAFALMVSGLAMLSKPKKAGNADEEL